MDWLVWVGLALLLAWMRWNRPVLGMLGWLALAGFWCYKLPGFLLISQDAFNALLSLLGIWICSWMGLGILMGNRDPKLIRGFTKPVALVIAIYFPFAQLAPLNQWLIGITTLLSCWMIGPQAQMLAWNELLIRGMDVEIILPCTAIESIALFGGFILGVNAPGNRKLYGLLCSVPVIYGLNLIRNWYVILAYGYSWYGDPLTSFYLAHHVISKMGSLVALIGIAYLVFRLLPELLELIQALISQLRSQPIPWR